MARYREHDDGSRSALVIAAGVVVGLMAGAAVAHRLGGWRGARRLLSRRRRPVLALLRAALPHGALRSVLELVGFDNLIANVVRKSPRRSRQRQLDIDLDMDEDADLDEFEVDDFERAAAGLDDEDNDLDDDEDALVADNERALDSYTWDDGDEAEESDLDEDEDAEDEDDENEDDEDDEEETDQDDDDDADRDDEDDHAPLESDDWDDDDEDAEADEVAADEDELVDEDAPEEIERQVLTAFSRHPVLSRRALEIAVDDDGCLALGGWVRSAHEIRLARRVAQRVPGVSSVALQVSVGERAAGPDSASAEP